MKTKRTHSKADPYLTGKERASADLTHLIVQARRAVTSTFGQSAICLSPHPEPTLQLERRL